jgi:glycosyltransferase involved in cell wall biosynthesis
MRRPRIAFVTSGDARSRSAWSGIPYYMAKALQAHCGEVVYLQPGLSPGALLGKLRNRLTRRILGQNRAHYHTLGLARSSAGSLRRKMGRDVDLVFAPAGSTNVAFLDVDVPVVYTSDTTFELMREYYPEFSGLGDAYASQANEVEQRALDTADLVLYPSRWAASSAREDYGVAEEKIHVVPYGANLDAIPPAEVVSTSKPWGVCTLLFLGVDWERKGGPIAYEAVAELRELGTDARLVVCGCVPPPGYSAPWLRVIPRLRKDDPVEQAELSRLLLESSFLLLPTRQECYGIVFCEASGHGTPSIASDTGGVAGAVLEGRSGFLLPPDAQPREYAERIHEIFRDEARYRELVRSTRRAYDETLNWDTWGKRVNELVSPLL